MDIPLLYQYEPRTREHKGTRPAQCRPNGEPQLEALFATPDAPGPDKEGHVQVYAPAEGDDWPYGELTLEVAADGERGVWYYIQDHRQHMNEKGSKEGGTPYWLPEDTWQSPARYLEDLGPLPAGALLTQPEKPKPTTAELAEAVRRERDRRISATDYLMATDYPLPDEARTLVTVYRQALRDLPGQPGFPWSGPDDPSCPWPALPAVLSTKEVL